MPEVLHSYSRPQAKNNFYSSIPSNFVVLDSESPFEWSMAARDPIDATKLYPRFSSELRYTQLWNRILIQITVIWSPPSPFQTIWCNFLLMLFVPKTLNRTKPLVLRPSVPLLWRQGHRARPFMHQTSHRGFSNYERNGLHTCVESHGKCRWMRKTTAP